MFSIKDCVREQFIYLTQQIGLFDKCSIPWTMDLLGRSNRDLVLYPPCNISEATNQSLIAMDFFYKAASFVLGNCKGKLHNINYKSLIMLLIV